MNGLGGCDKVAGKTAAVRQRPAAAAGTPLVGGMRRQAAIFACLPSRILPFASGDRISPSVPALAARANHTLR
jgi:hypothetical protein